MRETTLYMENHVLLMSVQSCKVQSTVHTTYTVCCDVLESRDDTQLYDSSTLVDAESVRDRLTSCIQGSRIRSVRILFFERYARTLTYSILAYVNKNRIREWQWPEVLTPRCVS